MFDGLPSESIWRRRVLYLGEGLLIGAGGTYLLILATGLIGLFAESLPTIGMILFLLFFLLLGYRFYWAMEIDRQAGFSPAESTTSAVVEDRLATRQWGWVVFTSVLVGGLSFGVSLYLWRWEEVIYSNGGLEVFVLAIFLGLGLLVYGVYDQSNSEQQEPQSES